MIKTQIQLPDEMYHKVKRLAAAKEWSLAEVCRRGVEYILTIYPESNLSRKEWQFPPPMNLGKKDPFNDPDWRVKVNMPVVENADYKKKHIKARR